VGSYICLSYFHPFQQFFIHNDKFCPFFIPFSSNLPTLYNVEKIVWPTIYAVFCVVPSSLAKSWLYFYSLAMCQILFFVSKREKKCNDKLYQGSNSVDICKLFFVFLYFIREKELACIFEIDK
jgi:hypothetical protein